MTVVLTQVISFEERKSDKDELGWDVGKLHSYLIHDSCNDGTMGYEHK